MELPFPVGPRAVLQPALLQLLAHQYQLGPIQHARDLGGAYNLNLDLTTAHGRFVARVYRPWVDPPRLRALHACKRWLAAQQVPVILPIATASSDTWARYDQRLVELEPYLPHTDAHETVARAAAAFALLGRLHAILACYPHVASIPPPRVQNYGLSAELRSWVQHTKHRVAQQHTRQAVDAAALCDTTLALLDQLTQWWTAAGHHLPRQLVHGDYGVGNLLWHDDATIGAIADWEFLAVHERMFEVAYALYWMLTRLKPTMEPQDWAWDTAAAMLEAYNRGNATPLTEAERRALLFEMARVPLYWVAEAAFLEDPSGAVFAQANGVAVARWLLAHADDCLVM